MPFLKKVVVKVWSGTFAGEEVFDIRESLPQKQAGGKPGVGTLTSYYCSFPHDISPAKWPHDDALSRTVLSQSPDPWPVSGFSFPLHLHIPVSRVRPFVCPMVHWRCSSVIGPRIEATRPLDCGYRPWWAV